MAEKTTNLAVVGVGGQGALTMMEMLALAAEIADQEVRVLSRVSLARLGGAGICHIRLGPASSPAIPAGAADILLSLEMSEVLRVLPLARQGARAFVNLHRRVPIASGMAGRPYPSREEIAATLAAREVSALFVPEQLPEETLSGRLNMLMLGVLCSATRLLPRPALEEAIALRLPPFASQNLHVFATGWLLAQKRSSEGLTSWP